METKNCPYCGGETMNTAKKCKHCGEWLDDTPTQPSHSGTPQSADISRPLLIFTYILASIAIWMGLLLVLHILYTATGIEIFGLFDTAPVATIIAILALAFCCFSIIPTIKAAWVKIAIQVASFMEVLALAGPISVLAMKLIYTESEIEYTYNTCLVNCGLTSLVIFAVLACINYFIQSRNKSIKTISVWTIGGAILVILLTILSIL